MADLALLAAGFGLLPFAALLLYAAAPWLRAHGTTVWGALIGAVAFLGLAHAGAALLEGHAFLVYETSPSIAAGTAAVGLLLGVGLGWLALGRTKAGEIPSLPAVAWAAAIFVALHGLTDGLVLGEAYAGPAPIGFALTASVIGGTVVHRFVEGSLIVAPGALEDRRIRSSLLGLLAGLVAVPAAFLPLALLGTGTPTVGAVALEQTLSVFASGAEAGFAAMYLLLGLIPRTREALDRRWALWAGLAFVFLFLVHFLVE